MLVGILNIEKGSEGHMVVMIVEITVIEMEHGCFLLEKISLYMFN